MFVLLLLVWIVLNGSLNLQVIAAGVVISAVLSWASYRLLQLPPMGGAGRIDRFSRAVFYILYLALEILRANLQVMGRILFPKRRKGAPKLTWFQSGLGEPGHQMLLANSITLTPGTITVSLKNGRLCVYAMDQEFAAGLSECGFVQKLRRWEEK